MKLTLNSAVPRAGVLAAALAAGLPNGAMAAEDCNAFLQVATDPDASFLLSEPIGIIVEIGAGIVIDDDGEGNESPGFLDIFGFEYNLDCDNTTDCNNADNVVLFDETSILHDCVDPQGEAIVFRTTDIDEVVTFFPETALGEPTSIHNDSEQTCTINFDVIVQSLAPENLDREIIELTGWANTDETLGLCSNGLTASQSATVSFDFNTTGATFWVSKEYDPVPRLPQPVDVHIRCNAGIPLQNSFTLNHGERVGFTVHSYEPGTLDCEVWEEPVPAAYTPDYTAARISGEGNFADSADGCQFTEVVNGEYSCTVTNRRSPATFTAHKVWDYPDDGSVVIDENVEITIYCDSPILGGEGPVDDIWWLSGIVGDGGSLTAVVDTSLGTANCWAEEEIADNPVVGSYDDCEYQKVIASTDVECTFYNTVAFEGIPTLSQYGMAIMALLMLGMGLAGYRRIA